MQHIEISLSERVGKLVKRQALAKDIGLHQRPALQYHLRPVVRTRGTSPQLHARIGGRAKRRRPNLWPYGWSILVIGLEIKQARAFND